MRNRLVAAFALSASRTCEAGNRFTPVDLIVVPINWFITVLFQGLLIWPPVTVVTYLVLRRLVRDVEMEEREFISVLIAFFVGVAFALLFVYAVKGGIRHRPGVVT